MNNLGKQSVIKKHVGFPVKIELYKQTTNDPTYNKMYDEWLVVANGFCIAHFTDEIMANACMAWIQKYSVAHFPKTVLEILEAQAQAGGLKVD